MPDNQDTCFGRDLAGISRVGRVARCAETVHPAGRALSRLENFKPDERIGDGGIARVTHPCAGASALDLAGSAPWRTSMHSQSLVRMPFGT